MAVRKQCNRYRTEPSGADRADVIKRAKIFFNYGIFGSVFYVTNHNGLWYAFRPSLPPFKNPADSVFFAKINGRWKEVREEEALKYM